METRIMWEELPPWLAAVDIDGRPESIASNIGSGPKSALIRSRMIWR
jgi:hypothetical protein